MTYTIEQIQQMTPEQRGAALVNSVRHQDLDSTIVLLTEGQAKPKASWLQAASSYIFGEKDNNISLTYKQQALLIAVQTGQFELFTVLLQDNALKEQLKRNALNIENGNLIQLALNQGQSAMVELLLDPDSTQHLQQPVILPPVSEQVNHTQPATTAVATTTTTTQTTTTATTPATQPTTPTVITTATQQSTDNDDIHNYPYLHLVALAYDNQIEEVRNIIRTQPDIINRDFDKDDAILIWAARQGHEDILLMLLELDVVKNNTQSLGNALNAAAAEGQVSSVKHLLDIDSVHTNAEMIYKALQYAVNFNQGAAAIVLIGCDAVKPLLAQKDNELLQTAKQNDNLDVAVALLEHSAVLEKAVTSQAELCMWAHNHAPAEKAQNLFKDHPFIQSNAQLAAFRQERENRKRKPNNNDTQAPNEQPDNSKRKRS